jgi:hypothetical protein
MTFAKRLCALLVCAAVLAPAIAFYLPGVAPRDYAPGETVALKVRLRVWAQRAASPWRGASAAFGWRRAEATRMRGRV